MMSAADRRLVSAVLQEYGALTRERLHSYLRAPDADASIYALARDYPERGGRTLRAALCIATAKAFGASMEQAINSAVALELLHNAFLVHDDVEDGSEERRGRPTMHMLHGIPIAVNVGDALAVVSLRPLIENRRILGPGLALRVLEETERMARESVEGQAMELSWRRNHAADVSDADYMLMILKKTCWYTIIYPCRVGALIGRHDPDDLDRFVRFGFFVGAAFQIQDDVLNLVGDPVRYGKEIGGDLYEGKRTLMLIHLLESATPRERQRVRTILSRPRHVRKPADVRYIRAGMDRYGSIEHARKIAHGLAGAAAHDFVRVFAGIGMSRDRSFLEALPFWVLERS